MSEITIRVLEGKSFEDRVFTCDLCGKKDKTVAMLIGGPFGYLCPSCLNIMDKAIPKYLKYLSNLRLEEILYLFKKEHLK